MSNLTNAEPPLLVHHQHDKAPGLFGSSEGRWSLADAERQLKATAETELAWSSKEHAR
jgi:hypothetical protein